MIKVKSIFGTRPDPIKVAPVRKELVKYPAGIISRVCITPQLRQMQDQAIEQTEWVVALQ